MDYRAVHDEAIVIDATCPLLQRRELVDWYIAGGVTVAAPTVGNAAPAGETVKGLGAWLRFIDSRPDLMLIRRAADIDEAKRSRRLGILFHFQGGDPFDSDLSLVEAYRELGVRMVQLTYNVKNRIGDGCEERTDAGLSKFGLQLVERLNANRIVVDCSHTGYRTTMEAIEASTRPVVFSHANARAVHPSPRNITDEQIRAVAATGGLVGINGFPGFVAATSRPTLDQFIDHIDYDVRLVGIDHVAIGIDYFTGQHGVASDDEAQRMYASWLASGLWSEASYPPPPYYYPDGIATPRDMPNLTRRLLERGYSVADTKKILGGNWVRVFREVWGA
jgi:membrane dipeptidase